MEVIRDDTSLIQRLKSLLGVNNTPPTTPVVDESTSSNILKAIDVEQRLCVEIVYKPIVKDAHGEWMSADTIKSAANSFWSNYQAGTCVSNLFHVTPTDKFKVTKSWLLEEDAKFEGREEVVTKGTWLVETHYVDDGLWEMKKSKKLGGLSLGGFGNVDENTGEITNLFFSKEEFAEAIKKEAK